MLDGLSPNKEQSAGKLGDRHEGNTQVGNSGKNHCPSIRKRERSESARHHRSQERYMGMSHPILPIRDLRDTGTAREQHDRWMNDIPTRYHRFQAEKTKWRDRFINEDKTPIRSTSFNEEALQIVAWWRDFIFNGSKVYR